MKSFRTLLSVALILAGAILLLGTGALYGYQAWDSARTAEEVRARLNALEGKPGVFITPLPTTVNPLPSSPPAPTRALTPHPTPLPSAPPTLTFSPAQPTPSPTSSPTPLPTPSPTPLPAPPARLLIPALGIDTPVVPVNIRLVDRDGGLVATWETADYAAGYHVGSGFPGQPGNVVISGHNNIKGQVFRPLSALGEPDVPFPEGALAYVFDSNGRVFAYTFEFMYKFQEVGVPLEERVKHARLMDPTDEPVLTLITCWPLNGNSHRIVVRARFVGEIAPPWVNERIPLR